MSYQVLARKWRPQRFQDVVGQKHVLTALENGLREGRLHHAYLFSGTRGVGKTSIARLFAKGLNCEQGISAIPCGQCENCKAIEEGRFIDLIEIDAASRTKVEDTRELLDNVQYKPTVGRFKVYLIDEVHMLSRHSFNALLKTLEEPPEYVKFLLATTDPQKLPVTILSRCMQFHLRALERHQISDHLAFVLQQEQIDFETLALDKLAKSAEGSIRDALSLTDQAIAVSNANITLAVVQQMLGLLDDNQPLELVQALGLADGEKVMAVIDDVAHKGVDWQALLSAVAEVLHKIAMLQLLPNTDLEETPLHFLAKQFSPEDVQFFYQLMLMGKKDLPFANEQRAGVEMTMLRALAFHPKYVEETQTVVKPKRANTVCDNAVEDTTQANIEKLKARLNVTSASASQDAPSHKTEAEVPQQAVTSTQKFANFNDNRTASIEQNNIENLNDTISQPLGAAPVSPALAALKAREQLKASRIKSENAEKKNTKTLSNVTSNGEVTTFKKDVEAESPHHDKKIVDLQQRLINLGNANQPQQVEKEVGCDDLSDNENYRWQWLDPELEKELEQAKPSDIKQAILQQRTPELVQKITTLSCEQDEWCRIIHRLKLSGLSRQIVLNSYLVTNQNKHLQLVLKPSMAHLDTPEIHQALMEALKEEGFSYSLSIGESSDHFTALEVKRKIFEQLIEEAKQALHNDKKLQLLTSTFAATIDESTIRPIVETQ
ncbi:DNA polymerase III subunit gamma/tau [Phocoenobacter skyensis]|uniref:DNA polymerase III subunit gamma/tau n=1 Tax=Phocoenobacter skyensis TaxID=97481 RepID=A0A1H7U3P4_9PAST|nr:DNA polymerase III subunit gamma/tau [Pasteurella skyensis]MDP8078737.1 DNA polymerase III subunit gamma/tau [Pasteurella skyensis]MDP8084732.1 DNA polymerase III subunit gamma/tau [Pasteurella skyensis]MDP8170198.1 DNA polymerase III subunit gamma/tau [Pasteurella skyensis]MDP8184122.1 DNA polymerase III subunit gamma/tau [Pasteurella skyensis]QLB22783.1 DNA polymerase III subunit gamma/tau [Pasteurella skyensis]